MADRAPEKRADLVTTYSELFDPPPGDPPSLKAGPARSIMAVAAALAEARYLSGDAIGRIFDEIQNPNASIKKPHQAKKRIA
jgi:hypothetical protein